MSDVVSPLTTVEDNVHGMDGFILNAQILMASELWALSSGDEFKAAIGLWCRAWSQSPPGSLTDDDKVLAKFSGADRNWKNVKDMALRGFVKCSDGRLYNETLCEYVKLAAKAKSERAARTKAATSARKNKRNDVRNVERDVDESPNVTMSNRIEWNRIERKEDGEVGYARDVPSTDVSRATPSTEPLAVLEFKLREASGWRNEPAPMLAVTGPIQALIDAGADLELDVLPTVRALSPKCTSRTNWKYFIGAIARARDDRIAASKIVSMPNSNGYPHATDRPRNLTERALDIAAERFG